MPIYWTSNSFPELASLPPAERRRILKRCGPMTFRHWQTWVALLACGAWAGFGAFVGWRLNPGSWAGLLVGATLGAAIGGGILGQVKGTLALPYIRSELQSESGKAPQNT